MNGLPSVSVVVVNYRRAEDTIACLKALRDDVDYPAELVRLVCVDNSEDPDQAARIAAAVPEAVLVETGHNHGFAGGCNRGVERATGEIIGFLNSDARPHPRWVAAAVEVFRADRRIASVASKVLDWDGATIDYAGAAVSWFGMGFKPGNGSPDGPGFDRQKDVLFGTGSAMFVRAEEYRAVGGFDERFFMFFEDVDLGWRLNLRGHRVRYEPASIAYHRHHASMAGAGEFREQYLLERNALMLLYKNLERSTLDRVLPAALALAVRRGTGRGEVDPDQFELARRGDGDDLPTTAVPKVALAPLLAIDRFVEALPELHAARAVEQHHRVRSDADLRPLMGDVDEPLVGSVPYLLAHRAIARAFAVDDALDGPRRADLRFATRYLAAGGPVRLARRAAGRLLRRYGLRRS